MDEGRAGDGGGAGQLGDEDAVARVGVEEVALAVGVEEGLGVVDVGQDGAGGVGDLAEVGPAFGEVRAGVLEDAQVAFVGCWGVERVGDQVAACVVLEEAGVVGPVLGGEDGVVVGWVG